MLIFGKDIYPSPFHLSLHLRAMCLGGRKWGLRIPELLSQGREKLWSTRISPQIPHISSCRSAPRLFPVSLVEICLFLIKKRKTGICLSGRMYSYSNSSSDKGKYGIEEKENVEFSHASPRSNKSIHLNQIVFCIMFNTGTVVTLSRFF